MKFNQFSKSNQLIAFMHHNGISVKPSEDYEDIVKFGITSSLVALQSMLSSLKAKGLVENDAAGYWYLTNAGVTMGYTIIAALDEGEQIPDCSWPDEDEDEQPSNFQDNAEAANWTDVAQKFAGIAQQFANVANGNIDSLQKAKSLEIENDKLKTTIANLRRQLNTVYAELDAKNMKIEHLEDSIDKLANNFVEMHNWAIQMKNGGN